MKGIRRTALALALVVGAAMGSPTAADSTLTRFEMDDQAGKTHSTAAYLKSAVIVLGSDRAGSKYNEEWGKALGSVLRKHTESGHAVFLGVADLRGVPRIFSGIIKHNFPPDRVVLLDWKGVFANAYRFEAKSTNILVFGPGGKLLRIDRCRGLDRKILLEIEAAVNRQFPAPGLTNGPEAG